MFPSGMRISGTGPKRSGITEFVVIVFLILVSLITGAILGGIVFGGIAIYSSPALVSVQSASCGPASAMEVCQLTLVNQGARSVATGDTCSIGAQRQGTVVGGGMIPAGGSLTGIKCVVDGGSSGSGPLTGEITLTNGYTVFFAGTSN